MACSACLPAVGGTLSSAISTTSSSRRSRILPCDAAAARRHATLRARLEAGGGPAPYADSEIAAIALVHGLTLLTVNTRDFAAMEDLTVEDWSAQ